MALCERLEIPFFLENRKGINYLVDLGVDGRIMLRWMTKILFGSFQHGNESSNRITRGIFWPAERLTASLEIKLEQSNNILLLVISQGSFCFSGSAIISECISSSTGAWELRTGAVPVAQSSHVKLICFFFSSVSDKGKWLGPSRSQRML